MLSPLSIIKVLALVATVSAGGGGGSAGYTVTPSFTNKIVPSWDGFGTSIAWWGVALGASSYQDMYANALFGKGTATVSIGSSAVQVPALGLNIVRYNVGGTGRPGDVSGVQENYVKSPNPASGPWYKEVEGFWTNSNSSDAAGPSFDWSRDANQRSMLSAATSRGVQFVEFFSNAPMWWMTSEKSSMGGSLQSKNIGDFGHYLAAVVHHAMSFWSVNVYSAEILNEPSSNYWTYGTQQEGANVPSNSDKQNLLTSLRSNLNSYGRSSVRVAGVDENSYSVAAGNSLAATIDYIDQVNVHGYSNDDSGRRSVSSGAKGKKVWMSEYGDGDDSGMGLAEAVTKDINMLKPAGWVYWQAVETSVWGLLFANFGSGPSDPNRGAATRIAAKYYMFAQFTRFILPGDSIVSSGDTNTVVAITPGSNAVKFVTVNYGTAQTITYDLSSIGRSIPASVTITYTHADGSAKFVTWDQATSPNNQLSFWASNNTIFSFTV